MQVLRILGFPISIIYALVVYVRNFLFDIGFFKSKEFKTPLICVGNLSAGGTGKTPMIELLVETFKKEYKPAVLSRGYGRKSIGFQKAGEASTVEILGDEPFQIHSKFPDLIVAVDADRKKGIQLLEDNDAPDIIFLDDAYQHRKVKPSFSILLTAHDNLYFKDWYLPTGNLRDSKKEVNRADVVVVTKCPKTITEAEQNIIIKEIDPKKNQQVLFSYLEYDSELKGLKEKFTLADLKSKKITLVTGIANPDPLLNYLSEKGVVVEHLKYRDHHFFSENEITVFNSKGFVLTTEKDYVRLKGLVKNLAYIAIKHQFKNDGHVILKQAIENSMNKEA
ncbi:tetraacyldisaccharide 4'-kinase [Cellulophaga sp. HaHaR_3_176]|uniref:tetraacyldisaccharide 4'-kinase n=1 Tax=Cellulophaga sp. HaHaR_3_176 TaxID=1942464 RepID=UPI001C200F08|nr:tetraacyldisaccharide 4'-kinase [Cellulophaga sp. HaHaR_3_176]QWX84313.1 tetraacyldisaccharide 4'-kinase [Cellulophaga sp. HaHaR_3_176]